MFVEGVGESLFFVLQGGKERGIGEVDGGTKGMSCGIWSRYCGERLNGGCRSSLVVGRARRGAVRGDRRGESTCSSSCRATSAGAWKRSAHGRSRGRHDFLRMGRRRGTVFVGEQPFTWRSHDDERKIRE